MAPLQKLYFHLPALPEKQPEPLRESRAASLDARKAKATIERKLAGKFIAETVRQIGWLID